MKAIAIFLFGVITSIITSCEHVAKVSLKGCDDQNRCVSVELQGHEK